jgi:hypothetical protein
LRCASAACIKFTSAVIFLPVLRNFLSWYERGREKEEGKREKEEKERERKKRRKERERERRERKKEIR